MKLTREGSFFFYSQLFKRKKNFFFFDMRKKSPFAFWNTFKSIAIGVKFHLDLEL